MIFNSKNQTLIKFIAFVILFTNLNLFSQAESNEIYNLENSTQKRTLLYSNLGLNSNFYISDFKELKGVRNCCNAFESGSGFGFQANVGLEFEQLNQLIGYDYSYYVGLGISDLSANYKEERLAGYKLYENEYKNVITQHILNPTLYLAQLQGGVLLKDFLLDDLDFKFGLNLGTAVVGEFEQYEEALSPTDFTFENNKRIIDEYSGKIENSPSPFVGINFGGIYYFHKTENLKLGTQLDFNLGLTNLYSDLNWKAFNGFLGLNLSYNLTQPEVIEVKEEPKPVIVPTKEPEVVIIPKSYMLNANLTQSYSLNSNDKIIEQTINAGDTIFVKIVENLNITNYSLKPIIYYKSDAEEPIKSVETSKGTSINTYENILIQIADLNNSNSSKNKTTILKLIAYKNNDQDKELIENRIKNIKSELNKLAKSELQYNIEIKEFNSSKFKNNELKEENNKIEILFGNIDFVNYEMVNNKVILTPELKITNKITADTDIENFDINEFEYNLNSKINNKDISSKKTANQSKTSNSILELYDFDADEIINLPILNSYTTDFDYKKEYNDLKIENNNNAKFNLKKTIFIKKEIETNKTINENTNNNTNEKFNEYLLALSNFDSDDISVLNQNVLDLATAALINDKKVEITGMNDQIGSVERNASLSKNRAIKGQNLIQKNIEKYLKKDNKNSTTKDLQKISNNIQIINFDDFYFSNENPYGRTLNRGIMVKIYK
ncbi:MAG: hypothetical protein ACOVNU_12950 [Candidatus Kapaibacteriota bacterium]